jgi:serine phosphatase RsbU (regulator of sigma subunit)
MTPAKEVGGDLYDFFLIDEDHLGLVIGDVSGKGVPASLFMMVAASLIRNAAMSGSGPAQALQTVNAQILARNPEEMFVTVWLGVLEISTGRLTAANAGHEYPALKKAGGHFELVKDRHGFVIGGMEGVRYREYELQLEPGSKLFVYTDGLTEATNASEQLLGTDRMIAALQSCEEGGPGEIISGVHQAVQQFVGAAPQFDDLTMLCLQYYGPAQIE